MGEAPTRQRLDQAVKNGERKAYRAMIFETHAHYDDEAFDDDRDILLSAMQENGTVPKYDRSIQRRATHK